MTEYKDVELLKKQIADFKRAVNSVKPMNSDYLTGYISALSVIEGEIAEQPAADVAEVVRCKDCEFSDRCSIVEYGGMGLNDYCSKGKRKELDNG